MTAATLTDGDNLYRALKIVTERLGHLYGVDADKVEPDTKWSSLGADSLDQVEMIMDLEQEFGVQIDDEAAQDIDTVEAALAHIAQRQAAA